MLHAHSLLEIEFLFGQRFPGFVFIRDYGYRKRPLEAQAGIVVEQSAFASWGVELSHLVAGFRLISQYLVSVRKSRGYV